MNFIILGDKFQRRMKSKGCVGLFKIENNKTIIDNQYRYIKKKFPDAKINYISGFEYKKLQLFLDNKSYEDLTVVVNKEYQSYGDMYSISLIKEALKDECFIVFGDIIFHKNTLTKFDKSKGSQIFIDKNKFEGIGCIINNDNIENISYELDNKLHNMYYLAPKESNALLNMVQNNNYDNFFLFELINKLIDHNSKFVPFFI